MISYGTGSYPQFLNFPKPGLHLAILQHDSTIPLKAPYLSMASCAYEEHDGMNRQHALLPAVEA
jgi:hypothetical protein